MKIVNLKKILKGPDGKDILDAEVESKKAIPLTFKRAIYVAAIGAPTKMALSCEDRMSAYRIAERVHGSNGFVELSTEELKLIKDGAGVSFIGVSIYGSFINMLEGSGSNKDA